MVNIAICDTIHSIYYYSHGE